MTYLPWRFLYLATNITKEDYYSNEEKIKIWEKVIKFYELVFEDKDYNFSYLRLGNAYDEIAELYIKDKNIDAAINSLYKAMYYYDMFDHLKDEDFEEHLDFLEDEAELDEEIMKKLMGE